MNTDGCYEFRGQFGETLRFIRSVFFIDCLETCGFVSFGLLLKASCQCCVISHILLIVFWASF